MRRIGVRKERYRRGRGAGWEAGCRARRLPFCREQRGGVGGVRGKFKATIQNFADANYI